MFDVFDILIPELPTDDRIRVEQHETAWGPADEKTVYVDGQAVGRFFLAKDAYTHLEAWAGSSSRADWTMVAAAAPANAAARDNRNWCAFLEGVRHLLNEQGAWRVTCESDCDQYPIVDMAASVEGLVAHLGDLRSTRNLPIAFRMDTDTDASHG